MQFPLRDFFWLSLVIGLAIGIAMERKQSREQSVHEGRALWWEKAAREVAERLQKATGESIQFDEMKHLDITIPAHVKSVTARGPGPGKTTIVEVNVPEYKTRRGIYARDTRQRDFSWVTGMMDLDMYLLLLAIGGPAFAVFLYLRKGKKFQTIADPDASTWKTPAWALFIIPFFILISLSGYVLHRSPFTGALNLTAGFVWTYFFCQYIVTPRLNPKLATRVASTP
jgi:hypothetical protein